MKIFYVKLPEKLIKNLSKPELKILQSDFGKLIVSFVGNKFLGIDNTEVIIENSKPKYKYSNIEFSISHSNAVVMAAFDAFPAGLDVEYLKERNFSKLSGRYGIIAKDKIEFYRQWTQLEAKIKIHSVVKNMYTNIFCKNYMLSVASANPCNFTVDFEELDIKNFEKNINY